MLYLTRKYHTAVKTSEAALYIQLKYIRWKKQGAKSTHLRNKKEEYLHICLWMHILSQEAYTRNQCGSGCLFGGDYLPEKAEEARFTFNCICFF